MTAPDYIFSPDLYADVRLPVLEAGLLPPWCYTSREFYEREVREIFMKVWNLVGRAEQIPGPGDYIALELAGVPVIILRDENREVRAFANTCRHRGCRLLTGKEAATDTSSVPITAGPMLSTDGSSGRRA